MCLHTAVEATAGLSILLIVGIRNVPNGPSCAWRGDGGEAISLFLLAVLQGPDCDYFFIYNSAILTLLVFSVEK